MKRNAIILLVHQMPEQLNLFLEQILKDTTMDIYIHINKKLDSIELRNAILKDERIIISNNNVEISWGDHGIMTAYLNLMKEALESGKEYNYILLGTGQDLLIRKGLDSFLEESGNTIFIAGYEDNRLRRAFVMHKWPNCYRRLMNFKLHPVKMMRRFRLEFYKRFPIWEKKTKCNLSSLTFFYNDMWAAYPSEVAKYLVDYRENNPDFMDILYGALVPEEAYFLTVIMLSKYKEWVKFDEKGVSQDLYYLKGFSNGHPYVIKMKDVDDLEKSGKFFSRKFDKRIDSKVIEYFYNKITK